MGEGHYEYTDCTLVHKAEISVESPGRITVVDDSTIFLSCGRNGLKVFHFDLTQFTLITSIDDVDWVFDSIMLNVYVFKVNWTNSVVS